MKREEEEDDFIDQIEAKKRKSAASVSEAAATILCVNVEGKGEPGGGSQR
jgi:hypothetical protein